MLPQGLSGVATVCLACAEHEYARPSAAVRCTICGAEVGWRNVISHYVEHGKRDGEGVTCPICNLRVKPGDYRQHVGEHFVVRRESYYTRGVCGRSFIVVKSLIVRK
jgi:endogenous inhibitor of DNA gyrase (YacG/DUF329 family)